MSGQVLSLGLRAIDGTTLEHLTLRAGPDGITASGVIAGRGEGYGLSYRVALAPDWTFRRLEIECTDGAALDLRADGAGRWSTGDGPLGDGTPLPALDGCLDIDLSGSPFTNTLPIRRVTDWTFGKKRRFDMAYIALPGLTLDRDGQLYTRLDERRFLYESADGTFSAEIEVDADGLVVFYPGLFERT